MIYTNKILAQIGRHVINTQPDIAAPIIETVCSTDYHKKDLSKIALYFQKYCTWLDMHPDELTGPVYDRNKSEIYKVFLSAMVEVYKNQRLFTVTFSSILNKKPPHVSRNINEVKFRYKKDEDFKNKVDHFLNIFK